MRNTPAHTSGCDVCPAVICHIPSAGGCCCCDIGDIVCCHCRKIQRHPLITQASDGVSVVFVSIASVKGRVAIAQISIPCVWGIVLGRAPKIGVIAEVSIIV